MLKNESKNGERQEPVKATGQHRANPEEVAYLAGVFDGEGYLGICHTRANGYPNIATRFSVGNNCLELLERIQTIIEKITFKRPKIRPYAQAQKNGYNYPFYRFEVADQKSIRKLCEAMLPYLTAKRSQALIMIEFCESRKNNKHLRLGYTDREKELASLIKDLKDPQHPINLEGVETKPLAPFVWPETEVALN